MLPAYEKPGMTARVGVRLKPMTGCSRCEGFSARLNLETPREYRDLVRQLLAIVSQRTFVLVHGSCPLEDVLGEVWPGDVLSHDFQCTACGSRFHLDADTYHGHVSWEPLDPGANRELP